MSRSFRITFNKTKQKNTMIRTLVNYIKLKIKYTQYYNYLNHELSCNRRPYMCFLDTSLQRGQSIWKWEHGSKQYCLFYLQPNIEWMSKQLFTTTEFKRVYLTF